MFRLIATGDDSNLYYRGGKEGLRYSHTQAGNFLNRGGVSGPDWLVRATEIHQGFTERNLSPGGMGDILAATFLVKHISDKNE